MSKPIMDRKVRVGFYGTGRFANGTHIPNLRKLDRVEIVAICDKDEFARISTAKRLGINLNHAYKDGHEMLKSETLDVLYSCIPAYARTDVEVAAVEQGIHLFSEKPQATNMSVACTIDKAVRKSGVLSTVGFRERYRPLFQEIKNILLDKDIMHVRFTDIRKTPKVPSLEEKSCSRTKFLTSLIYFNC